jgi:predicted DNA-binding transcriptional regulator AlpA
MTLDQDDVDAIARRLAELLEPRNRAELVDVKELARCLGTSTSWIYRNADRLGVRRIGRRLRFDVREAKRAIAPAERTTPPQSMSDALPPGVRLLQGRTRRG